MASMASQKRRWSRAAGGRWPTRRSPAVVAHHSAKASFEHGAPPGSAASARYVPTEAAASERRAPTTSSMMPTTPSRSSIVHTAARSPKPRCWERSAHPVPPRTRRCGDLVGAAQVLLGHDAGFAPTRADSVR